jgi:hypothetical protein
LQCDVTSVDAVLEEQHDGIRQLFLDRVVCFSRTFFGPKASQAYFCEQFFCIGFCKVIKEYAKMM